MRIREKLERICKDTKPMYFPVYNIHSNPRWKYDDKLWSAILVDYTCLPATGFMNLRVHYSREKTVVMCESGGLTAHPRHSHSQGEALVKQFKCDPDLVLTLDHPVKPLSENKGFCEKCGDIHSLDQDSYCRHCLGKIVKKLPDGVKDRMVSKTIENAEFAMKWKEYFQETYDWNFELVGAIQGYDKKKRSQVHG